MGRHARSSSFCHHSSPGQWGMQISSLSDKSVVLKEDQRQGAGKNLLEKICGHKKKKITLKKI
jgi:hypothetical protein